MEMIIGGAYQGKTEYAKKEYPDLIWKEGSSLSREELFAAEGVLNFHEVGYGVVPIDAFDRKYREAVGRVCTRLAAYSNKVTRVACGIGMVIKDD